MKIKIITLLIMASARLCDAQSFVNLGFESATFVSISGDPYGAVQFAQAFPGWTATVGGIPVTGALSNNLYLDTAGIGIINSNYNNFGIISGGLIQGKYTALLMSGTLTNSITGVDMSLSQTALVPVGMQSILFRALTDFGSLSSSFAVSLGGQTLPLVTLGSGTNYTLYGADITSFAGLSNQLSFTVFGRNPQSSSDYLYLDSIQFSTQTVPEPGVLSLFALGLFLAWRCCKRQLSN